MDFIKEIDLGSLILFFVALLMLIIELRNRNQTTGIPKMRNPPKPPANYGGYTPNSDISSFPNFPPDRL